MNSKARVVVKGYTQRQCVDYDEKIFSPGAMLKSIGPIWFGPQRVLEFSQSPNPIWPIFGRAYFPELGLNLKNLYSAKYCKKSDMFPRFFYTLSLSLSSTLSHTYHRLCELSLSFNFFSQTEL